MISNKYKIREQNESIILKEIIAHKNISRAELAALTGLNKASVSSITKGLLDDNLIFETGIGAASNQGGRKPILLQFNPKAAAALSFDLGTDYLKGTLAYLSGETISFVEKRRITVSATTVIQLLKENIIELQKNAPSDVPAIIGMTVGIHGVVHENNVLFTPYYNLDSMDLYTEISRHFDYPLYIENEANLAALGEYAFSEISESLVSISVHSGIGAGVVDQGIVQKGQHGNAGEIGHSIYFPDGKRCPCGNKGCLEQYASNTVLYEIIKTEKALEHVDSTTIKELKDDPVVQKELEKNAHILSVGINNIAAIYDPEVVIINSSVYQKVPELLNYLRDSLNGRFSKETRIKISTLGNQATLYGGIALCCQNFLNIQQLKLLFDVSI